MWISVGLVAAKPSCVSHFKSKFPGAGEMAQW